MRTWQADEVIIWPNISEERRRSAFQFAGLAAALGILLPANLSPLSRVSFNRLFLILNSRIGPYFVHTDSDRGPTTMGLHNQMVVGLGSINSTPMNSTIQIVMYAVLAVVCIEVLRRLLLLMRKGGNADRPASYGGDWGFWRWLIRAIRALIAGLRGLYGAASGWFFNAEANENTTTGSQAQRRKRRRAPTEPHALVRYLFARYLEMGSAHGRQREKDETAAEYRARLAQELQTEGIEAVTDLTSLYERIRYGQMPADTSLAAASKRYWAAAIKALRSLGR
jgi:hypothetical protein